jgi:uncharacterized protein (TIGR02145 family)
MKKSTFNFIRFLLIIYVPACFMITGCKDDAAEFTVTDIDGNTYNTVPIGTQEWMAENLRTTRYQNGDDIPIVTDGNEWEELETGAWCWYDKDNQYETPYGKLYNWYAAADDRNVCPVGWRLPSDDDWAELTDFLGGKYAAGGKMKATGTREAGSGLWHEPNTGATNESGFSGLPGGGRDTSGVFGYLGFYGIWWSSSQYDTRDAWGAVLDYSNMNMHRTEYYRKKSGFSVRCIKD